MNATLPISLLDDGLPGGGLFDDDDDRLFAANDTGEPMSDCHFLPLISVYHDGELPDDRTAEVERHMRTHDSPAETWAGGNRGIDILDGGEAADDRAHRLTPQRRL